MSDGDALQSVVRTSPNNYSSPPSQSSIDDGYLSEGGASFYAKKIQNRIAFEKQKTVEEQNRKLDEVCTAAGKAALAAKRPLPGLPDVLVGGESNGGKMMTTNQIYRVVGGRKHVEKSEAAMQTESNSIKQSVHEHYDWKQVTDTDAAAAATYILQKEFQTF